MSQVGDILKEAAALFDQRHAVYGDNYKKVGAVFAALFPDGVQCTTAHDWNRMHILMLMIVKVTRYTENWARGGHQDSLADLAVYGAMLQAIDAGGTDAT